MCNLYTTKKSAAEVAAHFRANQPALFNLTDDILPGRPGMVVREESGQRILQSMVWGFPLRFKGMKPESKPKPVNNIADLKKPMWIGLARKPEWRCLIPLTGFAEAEGEKGTKTRTWFGVRDQPLFAWAGLWRKSVEWGDVYAGVMTDCNEAIRPVHNRMPVILQPQDYEPWLHGTLDDVTALQERCFPDELITMERTSQLWVNRSVPAGPGDSPYAT